MNIALFTETFLPNTDGVVVSMLNMNRLLMERGHRVQVFTVGRGPDSVDGYRVFRTRGLPMTLYRGYQLGVPSLKIMGMLAKRRPDIIHSRGPFTMGIMAKHMSMIFNAPLIGTFDTPIHEYVHYMPVAGKIKASREVLEKLAIKYSMWYYNRCDLVTAPSETVKKELKGLGCKRKIEVLSNGVDMNRFRPENRSARLRKMFCRDGETMLFHVGRITKEKGVDVLLGAAKELKKRGMKFKLVIAGKGPALEEMKALAKKLDVSDAVVFSGFVSDGELPKYYATAEFFVTASAVETQGIVMLEALASGTPVIGADAGAIPELVKDGKNGFIFKAGDCTKLADRLSDVLNDESLMKRVSGNARESVMEHSLEKVCDRLERIYEQMTKNRGVRK